MKKENKDERRYYIKRHIADAIMAFEFNVSFSLCIFLLFICVLSNLVPPGSMFLLRLLFLGCIVGRVSWLNTADIPTYSFLCATKKKKLIIRNKLFIETDGNRNDQYRQKRNIKL